MTLNNYKILEFWHLGKNRFTGYSGEMFRNFFAWGWLILANSIMPISLALSYERGLSKWERNFFWDSIDWKRKFLNFFKNTIIIEGLLYRKPSGKLTFIVWLLIFFNNYWILNDHCLGFILILCIVGDWQLCLSVYLTQIDGGVRCPQMTAVQTSSSERAHDRDSAKTHGPLRGWQTTGNRNLFFFL